MTASYDIAIVGGGMVGAALACGLGNSDLRVAVVEHLRPPSFSEAQEYDLRVSALSIASRRVLEAVGAWEGVVRARLCPFRRMRVWEHRGDTWFRSDDIHAPELGWIVENRVIQLALLERLASFPNVDLICPAVTRSIRYHGGGSEIELEGEKLGARVLVAADGGHSRVRQAAGIGVSAADYDQHALVITVETAYDQQDITWQRFVPSGPQAFLPLAGRHASIVWYHTPDEVRRLAALGDAALLRELTEAFPPCLGEITGILGRGGFPLRRQHAREYAKEGVALVGDAAHMIHPLAGQGVNIGLLDAAVLAEVLVEARRMQLDFGSREILSRYAGRRRMDNLLMMATTDLFYRVFSNDVAPLRLFRNLGLGLAQRSGPAKTKVMRYAMGLEGNLPRLARGEALCA